MSTSDLPFLFDRAFERRSGDVSSRQEVASDLGFLLQLHAACSPLRDLVPAALIEQQARFQADSYARQHPHAMRRIGVLNGRPIGRFTVDWSAGRAHGVDLAVLPCARTTTTLAMDWLRTWTETADAAARSCSLAVRADNPAALIYRRLGFRTSPEADPTAPVVTMWRPVRPR